MRILFLTRRFYPYTGGVEKHVLEISKRLLQKGHTITVITEKIDESYSKDYHLNNASDKMTGNILGITIYRIPVFEENFTKKFVIWKWFWQHRKLLHSADIIHCHDVFFWVLPFRFLYPGKKIFTTFHGYECYPVPQKAIIVRKISEWLSNGNICIGDFIKKWYYTKPDYISYGAVDIPTKRSAITDIKKQKDAVFIGRLDEQTGILTYVKTFTLLQKKFPKFSLLVVGDGKFRSKIEKNVEVIGFKKDIAKYLSSCRFAFVSRYLSILEAMAQKKLVFAVYDNSIKKDYLQMAPFAPFIVVVSKASELAERIEYFLHHPKEERQMTKNAYAWVKNQSWGNMVLLYEKLWGV